MLPHAPWLFPLIIGGGAAVTCILLDMVFAAKHRPVLYSDIFGGVATALLASFVVRYYERSRRMHIERLRIAAEVNHNVRNALTMVLYSVHVKHDPELIKVTQDAVSRIDRVLRDELWESHEEPLTGRNPPSGSV